MKNPLLTKHVYRSLYWQEAGRQLFHLEDKAFPVKTDPRTLYPNILAEIAASEYFFCTVTEHARVSQEILWAVLEDREQLTSAELAGMAGLFGCQTEYLKAPTLQIVYPESNRGKFRRAMLGAMLCQIPPTPDEEFFISTERKRAADVFRIMDLGEPVTFAAWRFSIQRCAYIMQTQQEIAPRSARLSTQ